MDSKPTLLYILAPSYSGSTLLTYLLAQHRAISTVGELKGTSMGDVRAYRCSCGSLIHECEFWKQVDARARESGLEFSFDNFGTVFQGDHPLADRIVRAGVRSPAAEILRRLACAIVPGAAAGIRRVAEQNRVLTGIVCELQGGTIFLDGSKDAARLLHLLQAGLWQVRVIYLQRDGRGVANSIGAHRNVPFRQAMEIWREDVIELQRMRRRLDDGAVFDLHYEDLCRSPVETLGRLWSWLGVDPMPVRQRFRDGTFHILGNTMRLSGAAEIRLDERWRATLSQEDMGMFEQRNGTLNRQLAYE